MIELIEQDPNFSEVKFLSSVENIFLKLHLSIMNNNLEEVKHFMNENVYKKINNRIEKLKNNHQREVFSEVEIIETKVFECIEKEDSFILRVSIKSRCKNYIIDSSTKEIKEGTDKNKVEKNSILDFERKKDYKKINQVINCPNCGASLNVNHSGRCNYCGNIYNLEDIGWILTDIVSN